MARVDVEKMRRSLERSQAERELREQVSERAAWLAAMTPEHRARHEAWAVSPPTVPFCNDCLHASLAPLRRVTASGVLYGSRSA